MEYEARVDASASDPTVFVFRRVKADECINKRLGALIHSSTRELANSRTCSVGRSGGRYRDQSIAIEGRMGDVEVRNN